MLKPCLDCYHTNFNAFPDMLAYHEQLRQDSHWERSEVQNLTVAALDKTSPLFADDTLFDASISKEAIVDTAENLGLAIQIGGQFYPLRDTSYRSLLDRAKINGTALPKLSREKLADVLNSCFALHKKSGALLLIRDEKVSAVHSGDEKDYSILEIDQLLNGLQAQIDQRFPGNTFTSGYTDHALTSASWTLPGQKRDLLGTYEKTLGAHGLKSMADKLMPGIRFTTSDTGMASAKVSALLMGGSCPIHIGSIVAVDHRNQKKVPDFIASLDMLFAQFGDSIAQLNDLFSIQLEYPVNAMTAVCKALKLPKKAAMEAIQMFEMANEDRPATAHDVFMALQEIPFTLKANGMPESKLVVLQESMSRALMLRWSDYDLARKVSY